MQEMLGAPECTRVQGPKADIGTTDIGTTWSRWELGADGTSES